MASVEQFVLVAYCFMPDHVHILAEATSESSNFRQFVKRSKQHSGAAYALRYGHPLWQEGYFERVLRPGDDTREVVRYLLANPVRAGLVTHPSQYPYVGSTRFSIDELFDFCQDAGSKRTRPT